MFIYLGENAYYNVACRIMQATMLVAPKVGTDYYRASL